jgi:hypothetical protein
MVIGVAAVAASLGLKTNPTGSHGVLHFLIGLPFRPVLLAGLAIGLAGYAALNFAGAFSDPEQRGVTPVALFSRAIDVLTGAVYVALSITSLAIILDPASRVSAATTDVADRLLRSSSGHLMLWLIGIAFLSSCVYLLYRSATEPFGQMLDKRSLSSFARNAIAIAARLGTFARGLIFGICGVISINVARRNESEPVGDVGHALAELGNARFGPLFLLLAGTGFVAYGGYQLAKAAYQRIDTRRLQSAGTAASV